MRTRALLARFAGDRRAVAAVEFALVLPAMMVMYLGTIEAARMASNSRKVSQLARALADLTARGPVSNSSLNDIIAVKTPMLAPFNAAGARIVISSIGVYGLGSSVVGKVCSSKASGTDSSNNALAALARNTIVDVPPGYDIAGMRFIRADVEMDYTPLLGTSILQWVTNKTSVTFSERAPWPVRSGDKEKSSYEEITMPGGSACS